MRAFIVEDHVMFREVVTRICERELGYEVVGATGLGQEAVSQILAHEPDVVLLDLNLPDMDGFAVAKAILESRPATRIVAFSAYVDDYTMYRMEKSGMAGFVDKTTSIVATLRTALETVSQGKAYFTAAYYAAKKRRDADTQFFTKILSERECTFVMLASRGLSDVEIAPILGISVRTAETHRSHILHKLKLSGTPKLIAFAVERGLVLSSRKSRG
ncbi:MAG: two component transcriptional regulator, LuxR family [Verrucomicrobia bacterium]|nr:two component transcriptional regulator, LuxR family [Verrucomicrobiota bacterium]